MPEITFTIDNATGETSMKIKGVKGSKCKPIHEAVSRDMLTALDVVELHAEDTREMHESETLRQSNRLTLRS